MCGIVGYIGRNEAAPILVDNLKRLEYRGYDSAGLAVLSDQGLEIRKSVGKIAELDSVLSQRPVKGRIGIAHTRWATHGAPNVVNAHPHTDFSGMITVVHNGIIENYGLLKKKLLEKGIPFQSETDTEVVANLIGYHWDRLLSENGRPPADLLLKAVQMSLADIEGSYALGVLCSAFSDRLIAARRDCPLLIGLSDGERFLASDIPALLNYTRDTINLEDGDVAVLNGNGLSIRNVDDRDQTGLRGRVRITWDPSQAEKGPYSHFMLKEIYEQPRVAANAMRGRLGGDHVAFEELTLSTDKIKNLSSVHFLSCGTSWHAGLIGSYWMENLTGLPCQSNVASEFRYRNPSLNGDSLAVAISQSGETADTLAALRLAKKKGAHTIGVTNVMGSTLVRDAGDPLLTHCGPEIGVASTKAFLGQLVVLRLLALYVAQERGLLPPDTMRQRTADLQQLPFLIEQTLMLEPAIKAIAEKHLHQSSFLFLGRHLNYPIALEGALKLKEISYIHAEGYPAGEMKHGPIALIDESMPVVVVATRSSVYEKIISNIEEAKCRKGRIIAVATEGDALIREKAHDVLFVPSAPESLAPLVNVLPLQLLAYHMAVLRGCDVDKPRNLAKSVTVE